MCCCATHYLLHSSASRTAQRVPVCRLIRPISALSQLPATMQLSQRTCTTHAGTQRCVKVARCSARYLVLVVGSIRVVCVPRPISSYEERICDILFGADLASSVYTRMSAESLQLQRYYAADSFSAIMNPFCLPMPCHGSNLHVDLAFAVRPAVGWCCVQHRRSSS